MNWLRTIVHTVRSEGLIALLTGILAFAITTLLVPSGMMAAIAFGLTAGVSAAALDTLYSHLLLLSPGARMHAAELRYRREMEEVRRRLQDGSMRLREALTRRFEEDYRRSVSTHSKKGAKHQFREARQRFKARLWTVRRVITGDEFAAATAEASTDPGLLERWTERVDALVDARAQLQQRRSLPAALLGWARPSRFARQVAEERTRFPSAGLDGNG